jgi:exosortase
MEPLRASDPDTPPAGAQPRASALPPVGVVIRLAAALALAGLAYADLFRGPERPLAEKVEEWFFVPSASIAPLVLALAGWLVWRRVPLLRALEAVPGSPAVGAALLALALALHGWAVFTGAPDLMIPSLMLACVATAWLWGGRAAVRAVALPVAFLAFAVPIPAPLFNSLVFALQIGTTELAGRVLYLLGIPHLVAGEQIVRTANTFSVIESCSGLRSMHTLTMMAVLMADLFGRPARHGWLLVLAAPGVAFAMNGLRAVLLILNPHSQVASIHAAQGIAILLGGMVLLFAWDSLLERLLPAAPRRPVPGGGGRPLAPLRAGPPLAFLAAAAAASLWLPRFEPPPLEVGLASAVAAGLGRSQPLEADRGFLGSTHFRELSVRRVFTGGEPIEVFVGFGDRADRAGSALSPKAALPGSGWIVEQEYALALGEGGRTARARVVRSGSRRRLVVHWVEGARGLAAEALRSLAALDRSPWALPGPITSVRLSTPLEGPLEAARPAAEQKLLSFYHQLRPLLDALQS